MKAINDTHSRPTHHQEWPYYTLTYSKISIKYCTTINTMIFYLKKSINSVYSTSNKSVFANVFVSKHEIVETKNSSLTVVPLNISTAVMNHNVQYMLQNSRKTIFSEKC